MQSLCLPWCEMQRRYETTNIPIEVLRSFVTILNTGSFTKAALALRLTQSAVSAQLKRLESIISDDLFVKGTPHLTLTERGRRVSEQARRLIAINDQILGKSGGGPRFGLPSMYGAALLQDLMACCHREGLSDVEFRLDRSENIGKRFDAGHLDVIAQVATQPVPDTIVSWTETMEWISASRLVATKGSKVPWVSCPGSICDYVGRTAFERTSTPYATKVVASDLNSAVEAVRAGLGYLALLARNIPADLRTCRDPNLPTLPLVHVCVRATSDFDRTMAAKLASCIESTARES